MNMARRQRIAMALALMTGAQTSGAVAASDPACGPRCILVEAIVVKDGTYARKVTLTGAIQPKFSSNIAFRISGQINQRLVEIGDHVTADQVLARLDPKDQQANLDTAKAGLVSAQALLTQAKTGFDRQDALYKQGYATRPAYDQAQQQLRTQQAAVESAKAAVGTAEEQFGYVELKAGVAGIITARNAETGQVVQAGQTVFTLAQDGARDAVFDLYEALLAEPPGNGEIAVYLQADPQVATTGHVREISPSVDPAAGTVTVKVGLDSVPARMWLGAAVVGVGSFKPRRAIVLPRGALFRWQDGPAVWLLDPATRVVTPKVVTIDRYTGDDLILSDGVVPGDTVVTAGIQFLHPGQVVGIAAPDATPPLETKP